MFVQFFFRFPSYLEVLTKTWVSIVVFSVLLNHVYKCDMHTAQN